MSKLKDHGCTINEHITSLDGNSCECGYFTHQLIQSHTEKLKLLAEVRERVIGENDRGTITDPDSPSYGEPYESTTADKEELRAELTKLEAEL